MTRIYRCPTAEEHDAAARKLEAMQQLLVRDLDHVQCLASQDRKCEGQFIWRIQGLFPSTTSQEAQDWALWTGDERWTKVRSRDEMYAAAQDLYAHLSALRPTAWEPLKRWGDSLLNEAGAAYDLPMVMAWHSRHAFQANVFGVADVIQLLEPYRSQFDYVLIQDHWGHSSKLRVIILW